MKAIAVVLYLFLIVFLVGCSAGNDATGDKAPQNNTQTPAQNEDPKEEVTSNTEKSPTRVGNLELGMSLEELNKALTDNFTEEKMTEESYFAQVYYDRHYESEIDLDVSETQGILQFSVYNPSYETELGVKVGDNAQEAFEKYRAKYQEWVGNQSPDQLIGWFEVKPGIVLILDYDKDQTKFNPKVEEGAKIKSITLGYTRYFD